MIKLSRFVSIVIVAMSIAACMQELKTNLVAPYKLYALETAYLRQQTEHTHRDQIDGDDVVQQPRHDQNQYARDQGYEGTQ